MADKSKVTGLYYTVDTLGEADKIRLGFTDDALNILKEELKKVPKSVKKSHAKRQKLESKKVVISKPTLGEMKKGD